MDIVHMDCVERIRCLSAGACSAALAASTQYDAGRDTESHFLKIHLDWCRFFQKILINNILISIHIINIIRIFRLIQSHGKGRAASSAFIQKDPNRRHCFILEIVSDLFCRHFSNFNHLISSCIKKYQLQMNKNHL